ncbi:MAG: hypothetical protein HY684_02035 [Chloroflexi bacterium]|nr:hypothetical protein [Chloroflexota bacterium]
MKLPLERALNIVVLVLLAAVAGVGYLYYQGTTELADLEGEVDSTSSRLVALKRSRDLATWKKTLAEKEQKLAQAEGGVPQTVSTLDVYDLVTASAQGNRVELRNVQFVGKATVVQGTPTPIPTPARVGAPPAPTPTPAPVRPAAYAVARFNVSAAGSLDRLSRFLTDLGAARSIPIALDTISLVRDKDTWILEASLLMVTHAG